ncbi:unnamed protein product, partial [Discosporangium mesarthrocarpum]
MLLHISIDEDNGELTLTQVRKFYRPEDTHLGQTLADENHMHQVYWSYETDSVDLSLVLGRCQVEHLPEGVPDWDPDCFFFREAYNTK